MEKIALITGASRGLGAALAHALSATHHIVAVSRTVGALEELDDRIKASGGEATLAPMDICTDEAMAQLCRAVYDRWTKIDLWVHAAVHAAPLAPAPQIGPKDWSNSVETTINATQRLITYVAPLLRPEGKAVFFDDPKDGKAFHGNYGSTKAAQIGLVRAWQAETQKTGPRVEIHSPNPMSTATRARFHPSEDRDALSSPASEAKRLLPLILA